MSKWKLYVSRSFIKPNKNKQDNYIFDSTQIEEGLKLGLLPQLQLNETTTHQDIINKLFQYLKHKKLDDLILDAHGYGVFSDISQNKILNSIDMIIELNKKVGKPLVSHIIFHAGGVQTLDDIYPKLVKSNYGPIQASFSAKQYLETLQKIRSNIESAHEYANAHGINIVIENIGQVDYGIVPSKNVKDKDLILKQDERFGNSIWLPQKLQLGNIGCVHDLEYLTEKGIPLCLDIEHFEQSVEYSGEFNLSKENIKLSDKQERELYNKFNILVRKGLPIYLNKKISEKEVFSKLKGKIYCCHIGGQVTQIFDNNGVQTIGSHMPITFKDQDNKFYKNKQLMLKHNQLREERLNEYLGLLHEANCRRGIFEIHIGEYIGHDWTHYHKLAIYNVQEILKKL